MFKSLMPKQKGTEWKEKDPEPEGKNVHFIISMLNSTMQETCWEACSNYSLSEEINSFESHSLEYIG